KRHDAEALLGFWNFAKNMGLMVSHGPGKRRSVHQKIAGRQPHGERGLLACNVLPITLSVWTVSRGKLRTQNIFGGFHVRSQPSSSVEEVLDDLLVSHTTRTEPVLPIRLSSRQPIRNKKERRPVLRRERAVRRRQTSQ